MASQIRSFEEIEIKGHLQSCRQGKGEMIKDGAVKRERFYSPSRSGRPRAGLSREPRGKSSCDLQ